MPYVDAVHYGNSILVSERSPTGERKIKKYKALYYYYLECSESEATHRSMFGHPLRKIEFSDRKAFREERESNVYADIKMFESDVKAEYKLLEHQYYGKPVPNLHVAIIDIENFSRSKMGWGRWENPYAEITAITIYRSWIGDSITLALKPPNLTYDEAVDKLDGLPDTLVFADEADLLLAFLELIEDADVTTGWNSEKFDMPYIVARIRIVLGGEDFNDFIHEQDKYGQNIPGESAVHLRRLCLFGLLPQQSLAENKYGGKSVVFSFQGRPHLDYLDLYKKFILEPRESHKLDNILWVELKQRKVKFEGTLEQLYLGNYRLYMEYNRQDVNGLRDLDKKLGLIAIANEMAHQSCVLLSDAVGSVAKIERALVCSLHQKGLITPDKPEPTNTPGIAGGAVLDPRKGLYNYVCNFDVKSEYPSTIIQLNIGPETLVGQFELKETEEVFERLRKQNPKIKATEIWRQFTGVLEYHYIIEGNPFKVLTLVLKDGERITKSASEWKEFFEEGGFSLSANGTVFDLSKEGILAETLALWFSERKEYQKKAKSFIKPMQEILDRFPIIDDLNDVEELETEEEDDSDVE